MKLIDLLVQELPKRGGWPDGVSEIGQDYDGELMFYGRGNVRTGIYLTLSSDHRNIYRRDGDKITKDRYESALAASKNPAWNGEGLPPVGMHCEIVDHDGVLMYGQGESGEVISHVENTAVIRMSYGLGCFEARFLRPLRSEAERKRDEAAEAIDLYMPEFITDTPNEFYHAKKIYDAIAAGKIPGVKLDD